VRPWVGWIRRCRGAACCAPTIPDGCRSTGPAGGSRGGEGALPHGHRRYGRPAADRRGADGRAQGAAGGDESARSPARGGWGDVVALVEKAAATMDAEAAQRLERKARSKRGMDLADFLVALKQMQAMGPMKQVLGLLPGVNAQALKAVNADDKRLKHVEAIVLSMT